MRTLATLATALLVATSAYADGNSASATAKASATVVPPISVSRVRDLWFGEVIVEKGDGSRTIQQNADKAGGTREADASGVLTVVKKYEPWHNAEFEVTGLPHARFSLVLPEDNSVKVHNSNQPNVYHTLDLSVLEFNEYKASSIGANGKTQLFVGGVLKLGTNPLPGYYEGQFTVEVAYN